MRLALVLIALVVAVVLAAQNATPVAVNAFVWRFDASLAIVIVLCFVLGAIVATLALMPSIFRYRTSERRLKARVAELERTNAALAPAPAPAGSEPAGTVAVPR
jgi:uncharacterized integral membrane protein